MIEFETTTVPRRNEDVTWREEDGNIFIGSADGQTLFSLETVGADLWRMSDSNVNLGQIEAQLIEKYDIDAKTLHADVIEFMNELITHGLIIVDQK
jgi:coenzyme PQQ synthesis protein D (PqqD)